MKNIVLLLHCLLLSFIQVAGKVYKVTNAAECAGAATTAAAGDEIVIANGTYYDWAIVIGTNGAPGKPVLIRAETAGKVVFSGAVHTPVFQLTGSYTEMAGLTFEGCNIFKSSAGNGVLVELKSTQYCRVTDCIFTHDTARAQFMPVVVVSGKGAYNQVDHCSFIANTDNQELQVKITAEAVPVYTSIDHNIFSNKAKVSWKVFNGGECVQIGQDPVLLGTQYAFSTVRENRFIQCDGEAEVISNKSSGNRYAGNYFENCNGELVMRGGHDCVIDSNTFKGGTGGIRINGTHHTITNNTLSGLTTAIRLMYGMAKGKTDIGFYIAASNCVIAHNHISHTTTGIWVGDSKNADWTGKFDTTRYPSRTLQDVAPFDNTLADNIITETKTPVLHQEN